jgi:hypothetical protein
MAINYTSNFNGGELSRKMDGRTDLKIYQSGCRSLENFTVLPQGGVERRTGLEFIGETKNDTAVKLIPFEFSSEESYVVEIGVGYIRVYDSSDTINSTPTEVTQVGGGATTATDVPYLQTELQDIQFVTRYDLIVLTHPNHPPLLLKRPTINPLAFTIEKIDFQYPPLLAINTTTDKLITARSIYDKDTPANNITKIVSSRSDFFSEKSIDGYYAINYIRTAEQRVVEDTLAVSAFSGELDVSFGTWSVVTDGTFTGSVIIERSIDGAPFENFLILGDTTGGTAKNFAYNSLVAEGRNTKIRLDFTRATGTLESRLSTTELYLNGLVRITSVGVTGTNTTNVATCEILSSIGGRQRTNASVPAYAAGTTYEPTDVARYNNEIWICIATSTGNTPVEGTYWTLAGAQTDDKISNEPTLNWAEGSFDGLKGFPVTAAFFQNRLWFIGTNFEPATIYASKSDNFFNFKLGDVSGDGIKREIDSPEKASWLIGKKDLFLGTTGSAVRISSANSDELISSTNIQTISESVYGSSKISAVYTNNVIAYVQKNGLSLREMVYSESENSFSGQDLNLLSEDIVKSGIVEVFTQKQPTQLVWCILSNGTAALLTYERSSQVTGWAKVNTDGLIISGTSVASTDEDSTWFCVKRGSKYLIEKFHKRSQLDYYVDSGREYDGGSTHVNVTFTQVDVGQTNERYEFTHLGGIQDNDNVKLTNVNGFSALNGKVFTILHQGGNSYALRTLDDSAYITGTATSFTANIQVVSNKINNLGHLSGKTVQVVTDGSFNKEIAIPAGTDNQDFDLGVYANQIIVGLPYTSILRPMPIEPALVGKVSQSRAKALSRIIARFLNTKGAKMGEQGKQPTNFPVAKTTDIAGQPISLTTGERRFFTASDWDREKVIEIIQDLPYPMTVLSLATWLEVEGG